LLTRSRLVSARIYDDDFPRAALSGGPFVSYIDFILDLFGASIVGYWPLNELSWVVAQDHSPRRNRGVYSGVTLASNLLPPLIGGRAPYFDGVAGYCNILSPDLSAEFDGNHGSLILWGKVSALADWTDGIQTRLAQIYVDGNNFINVEKRSINNNLQVQRVGSGIADTVNLVPVSETGWMNIGLTWDVISDELKMYYAGAQVGLTQTGLGTWTTASLVGAVIGASSTTPTGPFKGWLGHGLLLDRAATPAQMSLVYGRGVSP
jgi:hypothetical protein